MKWWQYIFNLETVTIIIVLILVVYCVWSGKGIKRKKHEFEGLGESGWDVAQGSNYWNYGLSELRKHGKRKLPKWMKGTHKSGKKHRHRQPKINKSEEKCRDIFQKIYGQKFKSVRPKWLKNPVTGRSLELDGFCPQIRTPMGTGLAFEYDGAQHAKYVKHFHKRGAIDFKYQVKKDEWKDIRCKEEGITLVRIPHFVAFQDLERYIVQRLRKVGLLPIGFNARDCGLYF